MVLFSDLKLRTISSLILLFISLSALIMGGIYFDLLITLISIILSFEWMRIISNNYWIIRGIITSFGLIFKESIICFFFFSIIIYFSVLIFLFFQHNQMIYLQ